MRKIMNMIELHRVVPMILSGNRVPFRKLGLFPRVLCPRPFYPDSVSSRADP